MAQVAQLRSGDNFPSSGNYLVVDRTARGRAFDYFIEASPPLHAELGARLPADEPGFASLETALAAAQALAEVMGWRRSMSGSGRLLCVPSTQGPSSRCEPAHLRNWRDACEQ